VFKNFSNMTKFYCPNYRPILDSSSAMTLKMYILRSISGADAGFQARRGGTLKKIAPSGGRRENCNVIADDESKIGLYEIYFLND
jgi:hypothetical protein